MRRELPAGLSDRQRIALSEFFDGHLPAGQLAERLESSRRDRGGPTALAPPTREAATAEMVAVSNKRRARAWLLALVLIAVAGAVVGAVPVRAGLGTQARSGAPAPVATHAVRPAQRWHAGHQ
jgi:hypothetical protein